MILGLNFLPMAVWLVGALFVTVLDDHLRYRRFGSGYTQQSMDTTAGVIVMGGVLFFIVGVVCTVLVLLAT